MLKRANAAHVVRRIHAPALPHDDVSELKLPSAEPALSGTLRESELVTLQDPAECAPKRVELSLKVLRLAAPALRLLDGARDAAGLERLLHEQGEIVQHVVLEPLETIEERMPRKQRLEELLRVNQLRGHDRTRPRLLLRRRTVSRARNESDRARAQLLAIRVRLGLHSARL